MSTEEIWRLVPSVTDYSASSEGRIMRNIFVGQMPNGSPRAYGGRPIIGQWDGSRYIISHKGKSYKVARMVCEAFHGPAPEGKRYCLHVDENSRNNRADNLKWGTQKENLNAPGFIAYCRGRVGENNPYRKGRAKKLVVTQ